MKWCYLVLSSDVDIFLKCGGILDQLEDILSFDFLCWTVCLYLLKWTQFPDYSLRLCDSEKHGILKNLRKLIQ